MTCSRSLCDSTDGSSVELDVVELSIKQVCARSLTKDYFCLSDDVGCFECVLLFCVCVDPHVGFLRRGIVALECLGQEMFLRQQIIKKVAARTRRRATMLPATLLLPE